MRKSLFRPLIRLSATFSEREKPRPLESNKAAWPLGLVGMLVLVVAIEGLVSRQTLRFLDPPTFSWVSSAERATHQAVDAEILGLGDSLLKHGMIPSVIASETGRRTDNISAASAPAPWTYFVFKRALEAGAKPRAIVFDLKPGVLSGGPRYDLRRFQETLTLGECWELYRASRSTSFGCSLLLGRLLPSLTSRNEIRGSLVAALRGNDSTIHLLNRICQRNWSVNGGANLARKHPDFQGDVSEAVQRHLLSDRFSAHKVNAHFAKQIVGLARSRRIASYLVLAPVAPALQERRRASGADAKYDGFVKVLQDLDPGLTVVDARDSEYPASVFVDATHLDRDGAVALSRDLAAILKRDEPTRPVDPKRWIKLPTYREAPFDPRLEDIEGSRKVLGITLEPTKGS